jgi:hypothetical protein
MPLGISRGSVQLLPWTSNFNRLDENRLDESSTADHSDGPVDLRTGVV